MSWYMTSKLFQVQDKLTKRSSRGAGSSGCLQYANDRDSILKAIHFQLLILHVIDQHDSNNVFSGD